MSAAVSAAPVLITDRTRTPQAAPAALETTVPLSPEIAQAFALLGTVSRNQTPLTLSIPSGGGSNSPSAAAGWTDRWDDPAWGLVSSKLGHVLFRLRIISKNSGWNCSPVGGPRPVPAVTVPAPGSILLGSLGLLLVRVLRTRRIIV